MQLERHKTLYRSAKFSFLKLQTATDKSKQSKERSATTQAEYSRFLDAKKQLTGCCKDLELVVQCLPCHVEQAKDLRLYIAKR